ncbi:MAG: Do family serine endopeptidase [Thalassotalea sp.]
MKKLSLLISAALVSGSLAITSLPVLANLPVVIDGETMPSLAPMLESATPAVVSISVKGTHEVKQRIPDAFQRFFGSPRQQKPQERPFQGLGSGVIIDAGEGYIVTNNHVVDNADEIMVTLKDGRQLKATKLGSDAESDIALLQVEAENLTAIKISDSDNLRVGDFAVAIGSPFGLGQTVTSGIVSALGRSGLNIENFEDFIQTDAAINSGNSGGALVNLRGELIGINTAILGPSGGNVGIGFAIPSNMMNNLVSQMIEFGEIRRGVLGVSGRSVDSEIAKAMELKTNQGGFIEQVTPESAAEKAGLKAGDVITKVNGKMVKSFSELRGKIGSIGAGKAVKITVVRDGKEKTFTATLQKTQNAEVAAASIHDMLEGAKLVNEAKHKGIQVEAVEEDSPAQIIGLNEGDIIVGVNKTRTTNLAELRNFFKDKKGIFALNILRGDNSLYLMLR